MKKLLLSLFTVALAMNASFGQAEKALVDAQKKNISEAIKKSDEDVKKAPTKARLWLTRSQAYLDLASFPDSTFSLTNPEAAFQALDFANEAIKLDTKEGKKGSVAKEADQMMVDKKFSNAFLNMGVVKYQGKDYKASLRYMAKASEVAPNDTITAMYTGVTAQLCQEDKIAQAAYEKYLTIGGKDLAILYGLSQIYKNNKDEDKALNIIEKAIAIYPSNKDLKGEKFNMLIAFNRIDQAIVQLTQTTANDPKDGISWLNLGLLYENKVSGLKDEIRKFQDLNSKVQEVERRIAGQNDQIAAFQDEVKRTKAKLKTATTPKAKASVNSQVSNLEAKIKELSDVLKGQQDDKAAAIAAAGDPAVNKSKIDELTAKVKEIRASLPGYYTKALEIDSLNYDALYQMGAFYYNDAVEIKSKLNAMDMETYKKQGKELEAATAKIYKDKALPYFTRAYWKVKKTDEIADVLENIYKEIKDEVNLSRLLISKSNLDPAYIKDLMDQFEIVKRNGNSVDIAVRAGIIAEAYLNIKDESNYKKWKAVEAEYSKK
jgi:tetratricopeptide (TPR) repeat protein